MNQIPPVELVMDVLLPKLHKCCAVAEGWNGIGEQLPLPSVIMTK